MQEMTPNICNSVITPSASATTSDTIGKYANSTSYVPETILIDNRDNNSYVVRKLADGNCWMTNNLRLNLNTTSSLSNSTTDLNTKSSFTSNRTTISITNWERIQAAGVQLSAYPDSSIAYYVNGVTPSTTGKQIERTGYWYTGYAATAGDLTSYDYSSSTSNSLCPKGWRLPDSTSGTKTISGLITKYSISIASDLTKFPLNYLLQGIAGNCNGSGYNYECFKSGGGTYMHTKNAMYVFISSAATSIYTQTGDVGHGGVIRCVNN